jgi:hypothetical protein
MGDGASWFRTISSAGNLKVEKILTQITALQNQVKIDRKILKVYL